VRNTGGTTNAGGFNAGGRNTAGTNAGGRTTGGANTGVRNTGGTTNAGGFNAGGRNTVGTSTGGRNTAGTNAGGRNTGGSGNASGFNAGGRSNATHNPAIHTQPSRGSREVTGRNGAAVRTRPNGNISDVHNSKRGMDIHQGLNGGRRVSMVRPDHSRVVYQRGRPGFVERPYSYRGHDFDRRTYNYHGHSYDHFYHPYHFRGMDVHVYGPSRFWGPRFYGWAYNPWASPWHYRWGWMGNPWYGHYGYYFNPYPVYPSAAFWLTDYLISNDLAAAYAAQQDGGGVEGDPSAGAAPLTPDVKQMIADEVRNQLALENQEAQQNAQQQDIDPGSSGIGRILNDVANGRAHVFVVGNPLDVVDSSGTECTLSDGDALSLRSAPPQDATAADLQVLASKGGQECPRGDTVSVNLDDLQEMQNHMRETIDQGLQELQQNQGKGGLPPAPDANQVQPAGYAAIAPPPDPNVGNELQQEAQQADQAQSEAVNDAGQQGGTPQQ
jgi:hypothetical protein